MNKKYAIINAEHLGLIDFSQILQTSEESIRWNNYSTKFLVKWAGKVPQTISNLPNYEGPFVNTEILSILDNPEWKSETF